MLGVIVAGESIRSTVLFAELERSELVPAKLPMSGYEAAATLGVIAQVAVPPASVVPVQVWPARVKLTVAPPTGAGLGVADTSTRVPVRFKSLFGIPLPGLWFRLRNVVCLPEIQVTRAALETSVCVPIVAVAIRVSSPVKVPA